MNAIFGFLSKNGFVRQFESLFEEAVRYGFFINTKQGWYSCPTYSDPEKNFRTKYLQSNQSKDIWMTFLDQFDAKSQEDLAYKSLNQNEEESEEIDEVVENSEENE